MPERSTPEPPGGFGATDRVGERPRSTRADHGLALARVRVTKEVKAGPPQQAARSGRAASRRRNQ